MPPYRFRRSRKNGSAADARKPHPKSSVETSSSVRGGRHYPAYFTVDDLAAYRRRKLTDRVLRDNLRPLSGKFAHLKSEYRRRFKSFILAADASPTGARFKSWRKKELTAPPPEPEQPPAPDEHRKDQPDEPNEPDEPQVPLPPPSDHPSGEDERVPSFIMFKEVKRTALVRRPTTLKVGGDFLDATENKDQFREPGRTQRPTMFRRGTTLKLEGDMNLSTELRDKFRPYEVVDSPRSTLVRRFTTLHAGSGSMDSLTEYDSSYATPALTERPPLVRSMENLHVEGEVAFDPEYRRSYVNYRTNQPDIIFKRRKMDTRPEYPAIGAHRLPNCHVKDVLLDVELKNDYSPEYRRAYVPVELPQRSNFKRPRTHLMPAFGIGEKESELNAKYKPFLNVERTKNLRPSTHLHAEGKMECKPEYKASFVDFGECLRGDCQPSSDSLADGKKK